jgi:hypothetical protein
VLFLAAAAWFVVYCEQSQRAGERLQTAVSHLPRGITAAEALERLGLADEVQHISGVLHNNTMLAAENSLAARYGTPQPYEVLFWRRGRMRAAVFIDADGRVAGRTVWNRQRELGGGFFNSLGIKAGW